MPSRRLAAPLLAAALLSIASGAMPAGAGAAVTSVPEADTYSNSASPKRNYGGSTRLVSDASPRARSYLRFNVQGLTAPVSRATLRLYARSNSSDSGVSLGAVATNSWGEKTLTYNNAPAVGASVYRTGGFSSGTWISLDATKLVTGNGRVSLAITSTSSSSRSFASREDAAVAPRLVVEEVAPAPAPAPEPEPTPVPAPEPTPTPAPAPEPAPSPAPSAPFQWRGAQTHPLWSNSSIADFDRELDLLRDAGANVVRIDIAWSSLEYAGKGIYSSSYSSKIDTFMAHAQARGIKVIANIHSTPCWSSTAPADLKLDCAGAYWDRGVTAYPPGDPRDFADAVAYVARRWGAYMAGLEIWNEPNEANQVFLKAPDPAAAYATLLKAAYPPAKAAAPGLPILGGSLSFADGLFLERLYAQGIKGSFDGFAIHPYNENRDPDQHRDASLRKWTYIDGVPWIHEIMAAHGDGEKGIWLTELGFSTCNVLSSKWCTSETSQAEFTKDSFRIARDWPYVKAVVTYNLRNKGTDPADRESQFGLLHRDFTPKPGYAAFREALTGG
jgi:polysaccharide biosynthesis protein PslG